MTKQLKTFLLLVCVTGPFALAQPEESGQPRLSNNLTYAVAWKQTAAEYRALYYQGFNMARLQVELALAGRDSGQGFSGNKPLAVITDVDDTVLLAPQYWGYLISRGQDFFDDPAWDTLVPENRALPSPGALAFLQYCEANNVQVFYVTNRDQGESTYEYALSNLASANFPFADQDHLTVLRDTSNKEVVQQEIAEDFEVVALLGDSLNDFSRKYYSSDIDKRISLMEEDRDLYGSKYILFPNPTDGHWIRAIFGDSEPPPSDDNREVFKRAASRSSWTPQ